MDAWSVLGLEPGADERAVKRAYAKLLKQHRPDQDPEGFRRVRDAYEALVGRADRPAQEAVDDAALRAGPGMEARSGPAVSAIVPSEVIARLLAGDDGPARLVLNGWVASDRATLADFTARWLVAGDEAPAAVSVPLDLHLASMLAVTDPDIAATMAQRAYRHDRRSVDPRIEQLIAAGRALQAAASTDADVAAVRELLGRTDDDPPQNVVRAARRVLYTLPPGPLHELLRKRLATASEADAAAMSARMAERHRAEMQRLQRRWRLIPRSWTAWYGDLAPSTKLTVTILLIAVLLSARAIETGGRGAPAAARAPEPWSPSAPPLTAPTVIAVDRLPPALDAAKERVPLLRARMEAVEQLRQPGSALMAILPPLARLLGPPRSPDTTRWSPVHESFFAALFAERSLPEQRRAELVPIVRAWAGERAEPFLVGIDSIGQSPARPQPILLAPTP